MNGDEHPRSITGLICSVIQRRFSGGDSGAVKLINSWSHRAEHPTIKHLDQSRKGTCHYRKSDLGRREEYFFA